MQTDHDMETTHCKVQISELLQTLKYKEEELSELKDEIESLTYQMDEVQVQISEEKVAHEETKKQLLDVREIVVTLQDTNQLVGLKLKASNYEIDRLSKEMESLRHSNESLHQDKSDLGFQNVRMAAELDNLRSNATINETALAQLRKIHTELSDTVAEISGHRDMLLLKLECYKSAKCICGQLFSGPEPTIESGSPEEISPVAGELVFDDDPDDASVTIGVNGVRALRDQSVNLASPRFDTEPSELDDEKVPMSRETTSRDTCRRLSPSREDHSLILHPRSLDKRSKSPQLVGKVKRQRLQCSECLRKFKGAGRKLPSDLHTRNLKNSELSPQPADLTSSIYTEAGTSFIVLLKRIILLAVRIQVTRNQHKVTSTTRL